MTKLPDSPSGLPRRDLFRSTVAAAAGAALGPLVPSSSSGSAGVRPGDVVLFQGDSITDSNRDHKRVAPNKQEGLGDGYAWLTGVGLLAAYPSYHLQIHNRGVSGHKVPQLAERWQKDCLDLQPTVVSVLIGVNDIWHKRNGSYAGTLQSYEQDLAALLGRTRQELPKVRLVVCEPFVLRCGVVDGSWFPEFDTYRAAARSAARSTGATWVPFQSVFDEAVKHAPPAYWAADGVHPSPAGAALMSQAWLRAMA